MRFRRFGRTGWEVSVLGFGAMRLPHEDDQPSGIIEDRATDLISTAIDQGVNLVDTAYPYHGGESESFLGRALTEGYRNRVRLVTKMPSWKVEHDYDFDRYLDEQLERLDTERIDLYLLHGLTEGRWEKLRELGVLDWAERKMADGAFGFLGFSFHDTFNVFKDIVDCYEGWAAVLLMYNYLDIDYEAGRAGVQYAAERDIAVMVMEPLRGGLLARKPPSEIEALFEKAANKRTPADWALQWLWNQEEVSVVLSGMSDMQQLRENLASADRSGRGSLTADELRLLERVRKAYLARSAVRCTYCGYCVPCPRGVAIPRIFEYLNLMRMFDDPVEARRLYEFLGDDKRPPACDGCGQCEESCPQGIPVRDWLQRAHVELEPSENG
ncbi:aldo/keto reductase [Candidatus Fermentibacteria bacterium]|nr:aldo/keto reductase [Candidatus Fermentibacteria bacterium]